MAQRTQLSEARTRRLGPQPQMPEMMPEEPAPEPALLEQETALTASNVSLEEMFLWRGQLLSINYPCFWTQDQQQKAVIKAV